jgi:polyisoprenoid-binding protein YceI
MFQQTRAASILILAGALLAAGCGVPDTQAAPPATEAAPPAATPPAAAAPVAYRIDATHSQVLFKITHLGITPITGRFNQVSAEVVFDSANPAASRVTARIPTASLDTNLPPRDQHLRGADWFDAARFPEAVFTSRTVTPRGGRRYSIAGELHMKGIKRPLVLDAVYNGRVEMGVDSLPHAGFVATGTVRRSEYSIGRTVRLPGNVDDLADEVQLILELDLVPHDARQP